jgi:hypothetical protein
VAYRYTKQGYDEYRAIQIHTTGAQYSVVATTPGGALPSAGRLASRQRRLRPPPLIRPQYPAASKAISTTENWTPPQPVLCIILVGG